MIRPTHRVSCKIALFNPGHTKVLVVKYKENLYGLPGGHLERGELPEAAIRRELIEELGLDVSSTLTRKDFWINPGGKVILGFTAAIDEGTEFIINKNELESVAWVSIDEIKSGAASVGHYDDFILRCNEG